MKLSIWLLLALLLSAAVAPVAAQTTTTPILQVCMLPGNGAELSSNGCACNSSDDCLGVCGGNVNVKTCGGGSAPVVPGCSPKGNNANQSWNGCPCNSNNDCRNVCGGTPGNLICGGGSEPPGPPPICRRPGLALGDSVNGCPCNTSADCVGTCNANTRTCGGLVGAIANITSTITGVASPDVSLGGQISDRATVGGGKAMPSAVVFRAFGPNDAACSTIRFGSTNAIGGNGNVDSDDFTPAQAGTWRFRAAYQGNGWNLPATTACSNTSQQVVVLGAVVFRNGFE